MVQLRCERDRDGGRQTGRHPTSRSILDVEEVLDVVLQWKELKGVEGK